MAQLPDPNNNTIMDDVKVNTNTCYETKQSMDVDNDLNDNDSLTNHVDINDYSDGLDMQHAIISNRDNAPPPPSHLTMASLQHFDDENPPRSQLKNLVEQNSGGDSSQPIPDLGLDIMGTFGANNNVPDMLIDPLIEMGFTRYVGIYTY